MSEDVIDLMPRQRPAADHPKKQLTAPTVLIADTGPLVCRVLADAVSACDALRASGQVLNAAELVRLVDGSDLIIVDPFSFVADGVNLLQRLTVGSASIVVLTQWQQGRDPLGCLATGARGLLSKTSDLSGLPEALLAVLAGHIVIDPVVSGRLLDARDCPRVPAAHDGLDCLTPTERAVFDLLAVGTTTIVMTQQLRMTDPNLRSHISHVFRKLGLKNRTQAMAFGQSLRRGTANHAGVSTNVEPAR